MLRREEFGAGLTVAKDVRDAGDGRIVVGGSVGPKLRGRTASLIALCAALSAGAPAQAETISGALARAYAFSPDLGQQRASGRAADENVPRAASALRPQVNAQASGGVSRNSLESPAGLGGVSGIGGAGVGGAAGLGSSSSVGSSSSDVFNSTTYPRNLGLTVTQTLYNGNRSINSVRQAESGVLQSREQTRLTELNVLFNAASAYMNVLRDSALVQLNISNVRVLDEQLRQSRSRFQFGEITRTDVAQAEAALALGQAQQSTAESNLQTSLAVYRQLIGQPPGRLAPARPLDALLPHALQDAVAISQSEHPQIQAGLHAVDAAELNVKVQEGSLYPTVSLQGSVTQAYDVQGIPGENAFQAMAVGSLTVPIYDGGLSFANIRQAKEQLSQARLQVDLQRETIRAQVVSTWGALISARSNIRSFQSQIRANESALAGVREEAKLGQRTTLDILNAQQTLLNSRVNLISSQRDQVVQSYALLAAIGRLSATVLGLNVSVNDPTIHFDQVKDKIWGAQTPDGR